MNPEYRIKNIFRFRSQSSVENQHGLCFMFYFAVNVKHMYTTVVNQVWYNIIWKNCIWTGWSWPGTQIRRRRNRTHMAKIFWWPVNHWSDITVPHDKGNRNTWLLHPIPCIPTSGYYNIWTSICYFGPFLQGAYWSMTAAMEAARQFNPDTNITRYFPAGGSKVNSNYSLLLCICKGLEYWRLNWITHAYSIAHHNLVVN